MILAIDHRMAYEAAVDMGVDPDLLALYEAGVVKTDPSWYVEHLGLGRSDQSEMECKAANALMPRLDELLGRLDTMGPYTTAPIVSANRWEAFVAERKAITGHAFFDINDREDMRSKL